MQKRLQFCLRRVSKGSLYAGRVAAGLTGGIEHEKLRSDRVQPQKAIFMGRLPESRLYFGADEGEIFWASSRSPPDIDRADVIGLSGLIDSSDIVFLSTDITGIAKHNGWLWILGSHALRRPKLDILPEGLVNDRRLKLLEGGRCNCVLARAPLIDDQPVSRDGARRSSVLKLGRRGNALARSIREDALLAPFSSLPAREGGIELAGLAIADEQVAVGMRGPVIARHAVLLEFRVTEGKAGRLHLRSTPAKRMLHLEGLGIRDLRLINGVLHILAGPTNDHVGPGAIYRWADWASDVRPSVTTRHAPERILQLQMREEPPREWLAFLAAD